MKERFHRRRWTREQALSAYYPMSKFVNARMWLARKLPRPRLSSCAGWFRRRYGG